MAQQEPNNSLVIQDSASDLGVRGGIVRPIYAERKMKVFAVHKYELDNLSTMNTIALTCFSIGSALISLGLGIIIDTAIQGQLSPMGELLQKLVGPLLMAISLVPYGVGIWALKTKKSSLDVILSESESSSV